MLKNAIIKTHLDVYSNNMDKYIYIYIQLQVFDRYKTETDRYEQIKTGRNHIEINRQESDRGRQIRITSRQMAMGLREGQSDWHESKRDRLIGTDLRQADVNRETV